jgi:hypothetical protein
MLSRKVRDLKYMMKGKKTGKHNKRPVRPPDIVIYESR